ncbi:MAG: hypothetical protein WB919_19810 [Candidatus Sulfotelmatobacter sp.]
MAVGSWSILIRPTLILFLLGMLVAIPLSGRTKDKISYGEGLIINIPLPEAEVEQVVEDVAQNGLIRGTKEYNKDEFVAGAVAADSSSVFTAWDQGGKVFYKVRKQALDPRNFKDSGDVGTLVVRYVVKPQGEKNTVLRIDALFQEDFRRVIHQSNGSVESAEYKDIREHLDGIELMKAQNVEALKERQEQLARKQNAAMQNDAAPTAEVQPYSQSSSQPGLPAAENIPDSSSSSSPVSSQTSAQTATAAAQEPEISSQPPPGQSLEQRVKDLRKQVQRLVKSPGAPLKSAPFHTAGTLVLLNPGTEVLILISTPYWYGVETHEGQHGWMLRDQLEQP